MSALMITLLSFGYVATGYWLAMVANKLYLDPRPNKELSLWQKFKRLMFFPMSYADSWQVRHDGGMRQMMEAYQHQYEVEEMVGTTKKCVRKRREQIDPICLHRYNTVHAIFWGIKLIHLVPISFILLWKSLCGITRMIEQCLRRIAPSLMVETRQLQLDELGQIKRFIETDLQAQLSRLNQEADNASVEIGNICEQINRWEQLSDKIQNSELAAARFGGRIKNLNRLFKETQNREKRCRDALAEIEPLRANLAVHVEILEEHKRTDELELRIGANNRIDTQVDATLKAALALMESCRRTFDLEFKHAELDEPVLKVVCREELRVVAQSEAVLASV